MIKNFKELKVWEKAHKLTLEVYHVTRNFPSEERYGLVSQMRRAAISIPANIAEGVKKKTTRDFLHFLNIAQSSLEELKYYFELSVDLKYINQRVYEEMLMNANEVGAMLAGLCKSLEKKI